MIKLEETETKDVNLKYDNETDSSDKNKSITKRKDKITGSFSLSKLFNLLKIILKNFLKFYGIRVFLELMKKLLKHQAKILKYSLTKIIQIIFNWENVRTGLFLTIMPGLYKFFSFILQEHLTNNNNKKENDKGVEMIITFVSGFLASFIGIFFAEKAEIMNFIIVSIMLRSLHSTIVVFLKKKGYPSHNKFIAWLIFTIACFGVLFLFFAHPSFKSMTKLVDRFAVYIGKEKEEINYLKSLII